MYLYTLVVSTSLCRLSTMSIKASVHLTYKILRWKGPSYKLCTHQCDCASTMISPLQRSGYHGTCVISIIIGSLYLNTKCIPMSIHNLPRVDYCQNQHLYIFDPISVRNIYIGKIDLVMFYEGAGFHPDRENYIHVSILVSSWALLFRDEHADYRLWVYDFIISNVFYIT